MELGFLSLFLGAIIGAVISCSTVVGFVYWKKQSVNKSQVSKESIMHLIGELCAEIDSLVASNKDGIVNNSGIQNALGKKHDEIMKLLKPNMHILDVYFVKYIETAQKEYLKLLSGIIVDTIQSPVSSKSISFSLENKGENNKGLENNQDKSGSRTGSIEHDLHALESAFFKEPAKPAIKKSIDPILSESNEFLIKENISDLPEKATDETEFGFKAEVKSEALVKEKGASNEAVDEEEFTMETIVDLDIGKLTQGSGPSDNTLSHRSLKTHDFLKNSPKEGDALRLSSPLDSTTLAKKTESILKTLFDKPKDTQTSNIKNKSETSTVTISPEPLATADKNIPEIVKSHSETENEEKKDIEITGDDVAEKIDSFFGFNKKS